MAGKPWGKKLRNRMLIMNSAKTLFEREGLDRVTFNDIAEEAGMSRTTVFNHFPTINDLLLAIVEQEFADIMDYYDMTDFTGRELIMAMFNRLIDDTCRYPVLVARLISVIFVVESERQIYKQLFVKVIRDNLDESISIEARTEAAVMLCGNFLGLIGYKFLNDVPFDSRKMKNHFAKMSNIVFDSIMENKF